MTADDVKRVVRQIDAEARDARSRLWALDQQEKAIAHEREQLRTGLAALAGKFELCQSLLALLQSAPEAAAKSTEGAKP
jgi:hypothetical protein